MKLLLLIILCPLWSIAQWADDFSADLNNWFGDTAFFETDSNQRLHLNAPSVSSSAFLWHPSDAIFNGVGSACSAARQQCAVRKIQHFLLGWVNRKRSQSTHWQIHYLLRGF